MYKIIAPNSFLQQQEKYIKQLSPWEKELFEKTKALFCINIFTPKLSTHSIYIYKSITVYTSYINRKDRIIFFFKSPNIIFLYKIITDHDYKKLQKTLKTSIAQFLKQYEEDFTSI